MTTEKLRWLLPLVLFCTVGEGAPQWWHVSATGSGDDCSAAAPCREIRQALARAAPGDTVLVSEGTYQGFTIVNWSGSLPLTVIGMGQVDVTYTTDRVDNRYAIVISNSSNIVLDGLTPLSGASKGGYGIFNSDGIVIRNSVIAQAVQSCIYAEQGMDLLLEHNTCDGQGICLRGAIRPSIRRNRIHGVDGYGIEVQGGVGAWVEGNTIYHNVQAVWINGARNTTFVNNLATDNQRAISVDADQFPSAPLLTKIWFNTVITQSVQAGSPVRLSALGDTGTTDPSASLRNNILLPLYGGSPAIAYANDSDVSRTVSDYNIYDPSQVSQESGQPLMTLALLQAAGHDLHSLGANSGQLFIGGGNFDLAVPFSPAIGKGDGTGMEQITTDYAGRARNPQLNYDIGAFVAVAVAPMPGDSNGNGKLDLGDLSAMIAVARGTAAFDWMRHDVNGDGAADESDVESLAQKLLSGAP